MAASMRQVFATCSRISSTRKYIIPGIAQRSVSTSLPKRSDGPETSNHNVPQPDTPVPSAQPKRRMRKMRILDDDSTGATKQEIFVSPELLPPMGRRSRLKDYLIRLDCYRRRMVIDIPDFYVGSILAVTVSDSYTKGKSSRFVGICIKRDAYGLASTMTLRNHIDGEGVEICYNIYSPLITKIECLKLEKRLDNHLLYLRDAPAEYSTIDPNMKAIKLPPGKPVPVNDIKVPLKPKPWYSRWERKNLKGIDVSVLPERKIKDGMERWRPEYVTMDILQRWQLPEDYRRQIEWEVSQHERQKNKAKDLAEGR